MTRPIFSLFTVSLLLLSGSQFLAMGQDERLKDALRPEAKVEPEDAKLLAYFQQRVADDEVLKRVASLIRQLGDTDFDKREEASEKLLRIGPAALAKLQLAMKSDDTEVARRAKACVEKIEKESKETGKEIGTTGEAVYRLLTRHPAGTVEALVGFLPYAEEDAVEEAIYFGLSKLLEQNKTLVAALLPALRDKMVPRRALAGILVARYGNDEQRGSARKLLEDSDPMVRLRTAQGLLGAEDKAGIPTLIALLKQSSTTLAWQAEELLCWVAGEDAPKPRIGVGNVEKKKECQQAWETWWKQEEKRIDLNLVKKSYRRPLLLFAQQSVNRQPDKLILIGGDNSIRWELKSTASIRSMQLLPGDRILTAEWNLGAIERDLDGQIRWRDQTIETPVACRRLPNGLTIVVAQSQERAGISKEGTVVFHKKAQRTPDVGTLIRPQLLPTGRLCCDRGGIQEVEPATGLTAKSVTPTDTFGVIQHCETLMTGGYLLVIGDPSMFVEIDSTGKTIKKWTGRDLRILQAKGLPNGSQLISSHLKVNAQTYIIELDTAGRTVWEMCDFGIEELYDGLSLVRVGLGWPDADDVDLATSIPRRLAETQSKDPDRRCYGAFGLARMQGQEARTTPPLLELLHDPDTQVRKVASSYLKEIARVEELPLFLEAAKDPRPEVRIAVFDTFYRFKSKPDQVAPVLIAALEDKNVLVRREAASCLHNFTTYPKALPALIKALNDSDWSPTAHDRGVAELAAFSIGHFDSNAMPAVPPLLALLDHKGPQLRRDAIRALAELSRTDKDIAAKVIPAFVKVLKDVDHEKDWDFAAFGLAIIGPRAKEAIPVFIHILETYKGHDPKLTRSIRANVMGALQNMKLEAKVAAPTLAAILANRDSLHEDARDAAEVLQQLGPEARDVRPLLEKALPEQNKPRQRLITDTLEVINRK